MAQEIMTTHAGLGEALELTAGSARTLKHLGRLFKTLGMFGNHVFF